MMVKSNMPEYLLSSALYCDGHTREWSKSGKFMDSDLCEYCQHSPVISSFFRSGR